MTETSDNHSEEETNGEAPPANPPTNVTRTYYEMLAAEIMEDLDRIVAKMPKLEVRHRVGANAMRAHMNVPRPFLATAIDVTEGTPKMKTAVSLVPAEGRDTLQYLDAFHVVDQKLGAVRAELRHTMMSRRTTLAIQALAVYVVAKSQAREVGLTAIVAHAENLRRALGPRGRPRKKRPDLPESVTE